MNGTIAQNKKTEESNINKIAFTFKSHIFTVDILCNTRLYFDESKLPRIISTVRMHFKDIQCKSRSLQKEMPAPIETCNERNYAYYRCALTNFQTHQI